MARVGKRKNLSCIQWTLVIIFVIYWLIFFPIVWFVIQPPAFQTSTTATLLYALLFFAIFVLIYCIVYCCLKRCEQKRVQEHNMKKVKEAFPPLEDDLERPECLKTANISRKERPTSKRVLIPKVPEAEQYKDAMLYTKGDSNRDSAVTIMLYVDDRAEEKTRFVSKQELYFNGEQFLNTEDKRECGHACD
ncbi:uncharacterized protein LOC120774166 [Bactrocera tryoni]|uniref:uncharacterized protein LOC120774166 n=1 Tax=Bactrocera tryoni TaxID=59916 RepID=UPI001A989C0D|nr:uncharacterized protein LOC120774166 [Bactrocera tryoni]